MGLRIGTSKSTPLEVSLAPLKISKRLVPVGLTEQLYYSNDDSYVPDRRDSPLTIKPEINCVDPDSGDSFVPTLQAAPIWTVLTPTADGGTVISSTDPTQDYYKSSNNLIVRKNVNYSSPITIKCKATFIDPRSVSDVVTVEMEIPLSTVMETDQVYPQLSILAANRISYNPLTNPNNGLVTFVAQARLGENLMPYYKQAYPNTGDNPQEKGWYERSGSAGSYVYTPTADTSVVAGKTYYLLYASCTFEWWGKLKGDATFAKIDAVDDTYGVPKFLCYSMATQPTGKGQNTDTIVIDARYAEQITIKLRAKKPGTNAYYPGEVCRTEAWLWPKFEVKAPCRAGSIVKRLDQTLIFDPEVTMMAKGNSGGTLDTDTVRENFLFSWFSRDVTLPDEDSYGNPVGKVHRGIGPSIQLKASELWPNNRLNRNVFADYIGLGARKIVTCNGHPVTCNGHLVTCRDSVVENSNNS